MAFKLLVVLASLAALAQANYPLNNVNEGYSAWDVNDEDLTKIDRSAAYDIGASDDRNTDFKTFHDNGDSDLYNEVVAVSNPCGTNSLKKRLGDVRSSRKGATTYGAGSSANSWNRGLNIDRSVDIDDDSDRGVAKSVQRNGLGYGYQLPLARPALRKQVPVYRKAAPVYRKLW